MLADRTLITEISPEEFIKRANEQSPMYPLENLRVQNVDFSLLKNDVTIQNCEFPGFSFRSSSNNEGSSLSICNCEISQGTSININCKLKEISFHNCTIARLYLSDLTKTEIQISDSVISKLEVKGSIHKLEINGSSPSSSVMESARPEIDQIDITAAPNSKISGHFNINRIRVNNIKLEGINDGHIIFKNVLNRKIEIKKFYNQGQVSFYGISDNFHWLPYHFDKSIHTHIDIVDSDLSYVHLFRFNFSHYKSIRILDSLVVNMQFNNVTWKSNLLNYKSYESVVQKKQIKESYRQLKLAMKNQADRIQEIEFYAQEMKLQNEITDWSYNPFRDIFWDKVNLTLSYKLSRFGLSFSRPFFLFLGINYVFYLLLNIENLTVYPADIDFGSELNRYINLASPLRKTDKNLSLTEVIIDTTSRISSAYFIYLLVRYSRKFISK